MQIIKIKTGSFCGLIRLLFLIILLRLMALKTKKEKSILIVNNNIRSVILEIKNGKCKIVKILIFRSLSQEHFQTK